MSINVVNFNQHIRLIYKQNKIKNNLNIMRCYTTIYKYFKNNFEFQIFNHFLFHFNDVSKLLYTRI